MTEAERGGCTSVGRQVGGHGSKQEERKDGVEAEEQRLGNSERGGGEGGGMKMARVMGIFLIRNAV